MRVAVVSSAAFTEADIGQLDEVCRSSRYCCTEVLTFGGGLVEPWARRRRLPVLRIYGPQEVAQMAEALVVLWDGKAPDTAAVIRVARGGGLLVYARVAVPKASP